MKFPTEIREEAFQQSVGWGLAVLLVPFAQLVFTVVHWRVARGAFFLAIAGIGIVGLAAGLGNASSADSGRPGWVGKLLPKTDSVQGLTQEINRLREEIIEVEARLATQTQAVTKEYNELAAQRATLKSGDNAGVEAFNVAAAEYAGHRKVLDAERAGLQRRQTELNALLSERAAAAPASVASPAASSGGVVMYSTRTCPACRAAKNYFARKRIPYVEKDVQTSPQAAAEFRQLKGRGVPLLLIKGRRIEGFSTLEIDAALAGS